MDNQNELYPKIIAKAWKDEAFCKRLLANPEEALKEMGLDIPKNKQITVLQDTPNKRYFVLPNPPTAIQSLSEAALSKLAAADCIDCPVGGTNSCPEQHPNSI